MCGRVLPLLSPSVLTAEVTGSAESVDGSRWTCWSVASWFRAAWAPRAAAPAPHKWMAWKGRYGT